MEKTFEIPRPVSSVNLFSHSTHYRVSFEGNSYYIFYFWKCDVFYTFFMKIT